jgi:hypothetical protein
MTLDTYRPKTPAERKAFRDAHYVTMGACNTLAVATTLAETVRALRGAGVADVDRHPAVVGIVGQLAYLTGQSLGPPAETLTLIDHYGTMRQDVSEGTFHAVVTRDAEALRRDGQAFHSARLYAERDGETIYEITFADDVVMLADLRDLDI